MFSRYIESPVAKALNEKDSEFGSFFDALHSDDKRYVRELVSGLPRDIKRILISEYQRKSTRFLANTYLRETVNRIAELIPSVLKHHFDASEEDLRATAKECAERCRCFVRFVIESNAPKIAHSKPHFEVSQLAYDKCASYVSDKGINPPEPDSHSTIEGCVKRMQDEGWWLRKFRRLITRSREIVMIELNKVNRVRGIYCSDTTVFHRSLQKQLQLEAMQHVYVTNELGDEFSLYELYEKNVSNPVNRRNELMTRMSGFELLSKEMGHEGLFITLTCPSRFHNSYSRSGDRNPKWDGSTPYDGQKYLCTSWARIRAELDRRGIRIYGLRVSEPQHDGTPHWHLMLFCRPEHIEELKEVISHYSFQEDGEEHGAAENRVKFVVIDPQKGSATGYVAKYVCKNIDGANLEEGVYGEDPILAAQRVEAWASCWGIRQFQQIGGVSVTVWREIRRLKKLMGEDEELKAIFNAADSGDWARYTTNMGGVFCKRKEQAVRPHYDIEFELSTGLVKSSFFDCTPIKKLKGVAHKGIEMITPIHQWKVERRFEKAAPAFSPLLGVL